MVSIPVELVLQHPQQLEQQLQSSSSTSAPSTSCFHDSTRITYKDGKTFSLDNLKQGRVAECRVPHIVRATNGVRIETSCSPGSSSGSNALRLTGDHLLYTLRGLRAASTIVVGDVLFGDMAESQRCQVIRVTKEDSEQLYFGLNCHESIILANGLKASTFGNYHSIPAAWMKYTSKLVGVERASKWGDAIAQCCALMRDMNVNNLVDVINILIPLK
jgi:hypothetical protein